MAKFKVETEVLTSSANKLETQVGEYNGQVNRLYLEIQSLRVEWAGKSSDTFNTQIEGFRNDFEEINKIVTSYAEFLRTAAKGYEKDENILAEGASRLNVGN